MLSVRHGGESLLSGLVCGAGPLNQLWRPSLLRWICRSRCSVYRRKTEGYVLDGSCGRNGELFDVMVGDVGLMRVDDQLGMSSSQGSLGKYGGAGRGSKLTQD